MHVLQNPVPSSSTPVIFFSRGFAFQKESCRLKMPLLSSLRAAPSLLCLDQGVPLLDLQRLKDSLQLHTAFEYGVLGGERVKTREAKAALEDWSLSKNLGADTCVIGVGGGATLDLVAFFAATYARGLPLVLVPSTLLAMADASFGGKCGVNVQGIKNMVGTIYHPQEIIINVDLLHTLSSQQMASGMTEIAKHALLDSHQFVEQLFSSWDACLHHDSSCLEQVIAQSLAVKARLCAHSKDTRHFLNAGHTVAHALEALEGPRLPHGIAVAVGLYVEAMVGMRREVVAKDVVDAARDIFLRVVPDHPLSGGWDLGDWKQILAHDKKNVGGRPSVAWIQTIGKPYILNGQSTVPLEWVEVEHAYDLLRSL